jgi:hypothetical protein
MNFVQSLLQRWKQQQSPKKITGIIVVVHWDRENLYYFISTSKSNLVRAQDAGVLAYDADQSPLVALADYFKQQEISVQQLVVLLSRPELEQLSLTLRQLATMNCQLWWQALWNNSWANRKYRLPSTTVPCRLFGPKQIR